MSNWSKDNYHDKRLKGVHRLDGRGIKIEQWKDGACCITYPGGSLWVMGLREAKRKAEEIDSTIA